MTIPEAVQLILQAGCMGHGGEIFVLDMGKPMKILTLAEKLITLSGKRPYDDIDIIFTWVRPGEKLFEELFNPDEERMKTSYPQILMARFNGINREDLERQIDEIRTLVNLRNATALRRKFKELV